MKGSVLLLVLGGAVAIGAAPRQTQSAPPVTFNADIAPIVFAHCSPCHRAGEVGPFELLTYRDARQRATQVAMVTSRRIMPPWKPNSTSGGSPSAEGVPAFLDQRALTDKQIQLLQNFAALNAACGNPISCPREVRTFFAPS